MRALAAESGRYRGFNLIVGDAQGLAYHSNRSPGVRAVGPGIHGLSNHLLDTPWPKVRRGVSAFRRLIEGGDGAIDPLPLLAMLEDETPAQDAELPDTGVGIDGERRLSPMFLRMPMYGTRCSTVVLVERTGRTTLVERTHAPEPLGDVRIDLGG